MTEQAAPVKGGRKKKTSFTSSTNKTAPSTNSSDLTTSGSSGFGKGKPKSSGANVKTSSPAPSTTNNKKPGKTQSGKFAFQGPKTSRQNSPSSDVPTPQDRLFSLQDLKELAQIMREPTSAVAAKSMESDPTAATTRGGKGKREGYKKQIQKAKQAQKVTFKTKKGPVQFEAKRVKKATQEEGEIPPLVPAVEEQTPYADAHGNPYSYAFY